MKRSVILYGAGKCCLQLCRILRHSDIEILCVIDTNPEKWGIEIEGYHVESPEILLGMRNHKEAILCITVANPDMKKDIRNQLLQKYQFQAALELDYIKLLFMGYAELPAVKQKIVRHVFDRSGEKCILFDCYNGLGLGGVESWSMDVCRAMLENGQKRVYIVSKAGNYHVPPLLKPHVLYVDIEHQERFSLDSLREIMDLMLKRMPCQVIACAVDMVLLAACAIKKYRPGMIDVISVIHSGIERTYEENIAVQEYIDAYAAVSQDIRDEMVQRGVMAEKIYSITCPFPCEKNINRSYVEDPSQPLRIGYAGRMDGMSHSQKRMDLVLRLAKQLKELDVAFQLELAGDGAVRQDMEEFVEQHHLEDEVHFLGRLPRSELPYFWRSVDICINLSDFEGRSLSIIEAMGNGAVPVVTATSGVREDIEDGVNGYIVPLGNDQLMAERIKFLAEHRNLLPEMGRRAHDTVYPKSLMEPHLQLWEKILADEEACCL